MTDSLNQVGKTIRDDNKTTDVSLRRLHKKRAKIERANDIFDPDSSFNMEFMKNKNLHTVLLDLTFKQPVPSACCAGDLCSSCQIFNAGEEHLVLGHAYVPGSVTVRVSGRYLTAGIDFVETSPTDGTIDLNVSIQVGTNVRVCIVTTL